jgi:2-polyprenyl-3-methyl-5-hydroxy-6-metoxy-1,4-benzoquinol methylase
MSGNCRFCGTALKVSFADLGKSPLSNSFLKKEELFTVEKFYPLNAFVCEKCFLVQLEEYETPDRIFSDYAYFSSYSDSWLEHAQTFSREIIQELNLNQKSFVVEIASNDGYLLKNFIQRNIPCLGIEPAANVADVAIKNGIPTLPIFFGEKTAADLSKQYKKADLIVANNVLAHVPAINSFVAGLKILLNENGVISIEVPHLLELILNNQFDTIYHEHFSYFSLIALEKIFSAHQLAIFAVKQRPTHGGSLRIYVKHAEDQGRIADDSLKKIKELEHQHHLDRIETYTKFAEQINAVKKALLAFISEEHGKGKHIAAYGAAAKGNTLLNFCGIGKDLIEYVVDKNPHKQGTYLPGTHIPVFDPKRIRETKPDFILVLPWNLKEEIAKQQAFVRDWGAKFVVAIPSLKVF